MDRVGVNAVTLRLMLVAKQCPMSKGTLSNIITRSRPCSRVKAVVLNEITGVPLGRLLQWPPRMGDAIGETERDGIRGRRTTPGHTQMQAQN